METVILVDIPQEYVDKSKKILAQYAQGSDFQLAISEYLPENQKPGIVTLNLQIPEKTKLLNLFSLDMFIENHLRFLVKQSN